MLKTVYIWKPFAYRGTVETLESPGRKQDIPLVKLEGQELTPSKGHKEKFPQLEVSFWK